MFSRRTFSFQTFGRLTRQWGAASRSVISGLVLTAMGLGGIAGYESYVGNAMIPIPGDPPTLGFGETQGVKLGDKTTPTRALVRLIASTGATADGIKKCILVPLYPYEFDAYVSLAYNIGVTAFCNSTLVKLLNQAQYALACEQILRWDRARGKQIAGLTNRRKGEYRICLNGYPS